MAVDKVKLSAILFSVLFVAGNGLALEGHNGVEGQPHITEQPSEAPNGSTPNITLPGLPQQASDTANQVLATIQNSFQNSVQGIGEALQNLFSQNQTGN